MITKLQANAQSMLITACNNQKIPAVTLLLLPLACLCLPPSIIHWFGHSFIHDFTHSMKHREISVLSSLLLSSWMANDPKMLKYRALKLQANTKLGYSRSEKAQDTSCDTSFPVFVSVSFHPSSTGSTLRSFIRCFIDARWKLCIEWATMLFTS